MGQPISLLNQARAFARDYPRDQMPQGFLWDVVDFVPLIVDAPLTGRGAWLWGSDVASGDFQSGILMPFSGGDQLLASTTTGQLYSVGLGPPYSLASRGSTYVSVQNPVKYKDVAVHFDSGGGVPHLWRSGDIVACNGSFKGSKVGTVYKNMLVSAAAPGETNIIRFSHPDADLTTPAAWDANSFIASSQPVTAIAAMRSVLLVFHAGSVERIRGVTPPHGDVESGDMIVESLFDRAGCLDPRSIASWNDNVVFADEHGVHLTDGAVVRNIVSQGGILYYWRSLYAAKASLAACTFLDYYIITIRLTGGLPAVTLICDLNKRQWFRFSNLEGLTYIASGGSAGMERVWAGLAGTNRLARIGPTFFPAFDGITAVDDNGVAVMPQLETPWYRLAVEGRKRIRFVYLSYDVRVGTVTLLDDQPASWRWSQHSDEADLQVLSAPQAKAGTASVLDVSYIRSPQQPSYTSVGMLPSTSEYTRYRLPVSKFPYGIGFKIRQAIPSTALRIFDLAVEAQPAERSRV